MIYLSSFFWGNMVAGGATEKHLIALGIEEDFANLLAKDVDLDAIRKMTREEIAKRTELVGDDIELDRVLGLIESGLGFIKSGTNVLTIDPITHEVTETFHEALENNFLSEPPFPYSLTDEEIVEEIVRFSKTHEKWPITKIGYVSQFHIFHNSFPHDMTSSSRLQRALEARKSKLEYIDQIKNRLSDFTDFNEVQIELGEIYERKLNSIMKDIESLDEEISELNSMVMFSDEQLEEFRSVYVRTRIKAEEKIETLQKEILEQQTKEIIQHSRELSKASFAIGKKSVSKAQVRDYVNKLETPLIVPDSRNVLYARANFVMKGLRE